MGRRKNEPRDISVGSWGTIISWRTLRSPHSRIIWQYAKSHDPQPGHELKPTGKRFRTQTSRTGRVTCTLCFLYIDIDYHALQMLIGIIVAKLNRNDNGIENHGDETLKGITHHALCKIPVWITVAKTEEIARELKMDLLWIFALESGTWESLWNEEKDEKKGWK